MDGIKIIDKSAFRVIGIAGRGDADKGPQWIPALWKAANAHFDEIASLALRDERGALRGLWGAMSDIDLTFKRWGAQGLYLAGCETRSDAGAPRGWDCWDIPAFRYVAALATQETYGDVFNAIINDYIPRNGFTIAGAIHEFYDVDGDGGLWLYFPIEKL